MAEIEIGATGEASQVVTPELTAAQFGSGLVASYSTPALIGLMEGASVNAIERFMDPGQTSVGIEVNAKHLAATPVGMRVTARAEVVEVDGRRVKFNVTAFDDMEPVGEGTHWRVLVDMARFQQRFNEKVEKAKSAGSNRRSE